MQKSDELFVYGFVGVYYVNKWDWGVVANVHLIEFCFFVVAVVVVVVVAMTST